jgi:hypothetical protein
MSPAAVANVIGAALGRRRRRAHTAGLLLQRGPAAAFDANVTGVALGRCPRASSRAHTDGLVVQVVAGVTWLATAGRADGATTSGAGVLCFLWAARRAHTAGLVVHVGAACPSAGSIQTNAPNAAARADAAQARCEPARENFRLHENIESMDRPF